MTKENYDFQYKVAEALDQMQGVEAIVAHRRFLGGHSYNEIARDLQIQPAEAIQIAAGGLRSIKSHVYKKNP